jgi:hypothetical protein
VHKRIIPAVKRAEFVSDGMSYIILRGHWCHIIVLNIPVPTEDKTDDVKASFYEELERVFDKFLKYHTKILLRDFNAKASREDIFKQTTGNESLHQISNDNGVRLVNFATYKNLRVKSMMFPHRNIYKYTWTSPDWKMHNQIGHILVDRRRHSNVLYVRSHRTADCDTDHFRNKKREYPKNKINELATNSKNKNIKNLYRGRNEFKRGYQPRNNLVKDENGDLLAVSHNILNRCKNYFSQLLNVHNFSDILQIEVCTAEPLVPGPNRLEIETPITKLEKV